MRCSWGVVILTLVAWAVRVPAESSAAEPVFTNKPHFRIPFRFDAAEMQRLHPREIQLYVSYDQGARWQHAQSADPGSGKFDFEATQDGEYWFAVKTLDFQNRQYPRDNSQPGLKVVVDTTQPKLEVTLRDVGHGKVQLSWNALDTNIDPTTLRLEYMQTGSQDWQQVSVVPQPSGQTTWSVPQGGSVAIRGVVNDLAGNTGQAETQIKLGADRDSNPESEDTEYREPVAGRQLPQDPFSPAAGAASGIGGNGMRGVPSTLLETPQVAARPKAAGSSASSENASIAAPGNKLISDSPATRPEVIQRRLPPTQTPEPAAGQTAKPALKQTVNSRNFQIGYRIDGAGPAGVSGVELYVTQDGGGQWIKYGEDPDRQSPFAVTVPADGEYGFELRVRNSAGPSIEPPQRGDKPSIIVVVDQTPPVAILLPVEPGEGGSQSALIIQWEVSDEHLGSAPIALSCAPSPAGPWRQIGDWQPNSGRFVWSPEPGSPPKIYLRLTARDEAGNVTEVASPNIVIVDRPKPSVRIMGVESPDPQAKPY